MAFLIEPVIAILCEAKILRLSFAVANSGPRISVERNLPQARWLKGKLGWGEPPATKIEKSYQRLSKYGQSAPIVSILSDWGTTSPTPPNSSLRLLKYQ